MVIFWYWVSFHLRNLSDSKCTVECNYLCYRWLSRVEISPYIFREDNFKTFLTTNAFEIENEWKNRFSLCTHKNVFCERWSWIFDSFLLKSHPRSIGTVKFGTEITNKLSLVCEKMQKFIIYWWHCMDLISHSTNCFFWNFNINYSRIVVVNISFFIDVNIRQALVESYCINNRNSF